MKGTMKKNAHGLSHIIIFCQVLSNVLIITGYCFLLIINLLIFDNKKKTESDDWDIQNLEHFIGIGECRKTSGNKAKSSTNLLVSYLMKPIQWK